MHLKCAAHPNPAHKEKPMKWRFECIYGKPLEPTRFRIVLYTILQRIHSVTYRTLYYSMENSRWNDDANCVSIYIYIYGIGGIGGIVWHHWHHICKTIYNIYTSAFSGKTSNWAMCIMGIILIKWTIPNVVLLGNDVKGWWVTPRGYTVIPYLHVNCNRETAAAGVLDHLEVLALLYRSRGCAF